MKSTFKLLAINVLFIGLFVAGLAFNILQQIYVNDVSKITYLITGMMFLNVILSIYNSWNKELSFFLKITKIDNYLDYIQDKFPFIGICGTLVGLILLVDAIQLTGSGDISAQVSNIIIVLKESMRTMFNPTLVGVVAYLWTSLLLFIDTGE